MPSHLPESQHESEMPVIPQINVEDTVGFFSSTPDQSLD